MLFYACSDDDLNSVNASAIDNLNFITKEAVFDVDFENEDVDKLESQINGQFLLGKYEESGMNTITGSFVSQLVLPTDIYKTDEARDEGDIETTFSMDDVVLYLPYYATGTNTVDGIEYQLDSVFPVPEAEEPYGKFSFEVHELDTFLNPLDPSAPSSANVFYTDKVYTEKSILATVEDYVPSSNNDDDIKTIIIRDLALGNDTIRLPNNAPRIAIRLVQTTFDEILEKLPLQGGQIDDDIKNSESFIRYFKGLYVKTTSDDPGSIVTLSLRDAFVEMYYTYTEKIISTSEETSVKKTKRFNLGGVKAVQYEKNSIVKVVNKLYVQGTSGSEVNIKLFDYNDTPPNETVISIELSDLRNEANDADGNLLWLINEASLFFYVDGDQKPNIDKLFLYKKVPEISERLPYNSQLLDYISSSLLSAIEGSLLQDDTGNYYYKFRLTDYITELLDGKNTNNVDNLALKIYNPGDYPESSNDTIVSSYNWNPRGVILWEGDEDLGLKLKINYSYKK